MILYFFICTPLMRAEYGFCKASRFEKRKAQEDGIAHQYCGKETFFGRTVVESVTGLKSTRASEVLQLLLRNNIIEKVQGHGKGKYRFL